MPDVTLTPQAPTRATPADFTTNKTAAVSGTNYLIANDGNTRLIANSSGGGNLTIATPGTVDGLAIADLVIALTAARTYITATFPPSVYGDTITATVSANTDLMAVKG